jgi:hypothetical protein
MPNTTEMIDRLRLAERERDRIRHDQRQTEDRRRWSVERALEIAKDTHDLSDDWVLDCARKLEEYVKP